MLRLAVFFVAVLGLTFLLRHVPVLGAFFGIPLLGFWLTAILLSAGLSWAAQRALQRRRFQSQARSLGAVDTPANQGKLGVLLLSTGDARRALPYLTAAHAGEPEWGEWSYRLGEARLATGDAAGALDALGPLLKRDEEHAYGRALLLAARAASAVGDHASALARVERHDRNHGATPESAFERGQALRGLGRADEARAAFGDVPRLAAEAAHYKRKTSLALVWRARLARLG